MFVGLPCYSAETIRQFISSFEEVKYVREGMFGRIYVGEVRHQKIAIKMIPKVPVITLSDHSIHQSQCTCITHVLGT